MSSAVKFDIPKAKAKVDKYLEDRLVILGSFLVSESVYRCVVGHYPKGSGRVGGRLRGSITYATVDLVSDVRPKGNPPASPKDAVDKPKGKLVVRIGSNVEYAIWVELGVNGNEKNAGFLRNAIEQNKKRIIQIISGKR